MGTINIPEQNRPTGVVPFGPITVASGLTGFLMTVARCTSATPTIWSNAASQIVLTLDCSYNGGTIYQVGQFRWSSRGGIELDKFGVEKSSWVVRARVEPNQPTHIRGTFEIVNGPIRTSASIITL